MLTFMNSESYQIFLPIHKCGLPKKGLELNALKQHSEVGVSLRGESENCQVQR